MIEDAADINALIRAPETEIAGWQFPDGKKAYSGLRILRGHIAIRDRFAFPVIDGKTSLQHFDENPPEKAKQTLVEPLTETGTLSSALFIPGVTNYYHFLAFNMPALPLLARFPGERVRLATVHGFPPKAAGLLDRLLPHLAGGRPVDVIRVPGGDYAARDVIFRIKASPWLAVTMAHETMRFVMGAGGISDAMAAPGPVKLFVQRLGKTTGRMLANQDATRDWLARRGYVAINPGDYTMEEQISLFARATHIVGVEGAGMANILFARNARSVVMLASATTRDEDTFSILAKQLPFRFETVFGDVVANLDRDRYADFHIPLEVLESLEGDLIA